MPRMYTRAYRGQTQSEVLGRFTADAPRTEAAGFRPVAQEWQQDGGEQVLAVTFTRVSLAPRSLDGTPLPLDERIASLRRVLSGLTARGWGIERLADEKAVVVRGHGLSTAAHVVHGFLTLGTVGVWGIVWVLHWSMRRPRRRLIQIDETGLIAAGTYDARTGTLKRLGPPTSYNGAMFLAGQPVVTPDAKVNAASTILCELEGDQVPDIAIQSLVINASYQYLEVHVTARPEPDTALTWFVLN